MEKVCKGNHTCLYKDYMENSVLKENRNNPKCNEQKLKVYI